MPGSLVEITDVIRRIPRDVDPGEYDRIEAICEDVSSVVRSYCRRSFDQETVTQKLRPIGDKLKLPEKPVTSVDSVFVDYNGERLPMANWVWDGGNELWFISGEVVINLAADLVDLFAYHTPMVEVTYTYGYDEIPDDVQMVVYSMAIRAWYTPNAGAMVSETAGPYTYRLARAAPTGMFGLMPDEREILNRYRLTASSVELRT